VLVFLETQKLEKGINNELKISVVSINLFSTWIRRFLIFFNFQKKLDVVKTNISSGLNEYHLNIKEFESKNLKESAEKLKDLDGIS
jgi:hypothetical protein